MSIHTLPQLPSMAPTVEENDVTLLDNLGRRLTPIAMPPLDIVVSSQHGRKIAVYRNQRSLIRALETRMLVLTAGDFISVRTWL